MGHGCLSGMKWGTNGVEGMKWKINEIDYETCDMVDNPKHYMSESGLESIDVIKSFVEDYPSYAHGNILKYIMRWRNKNGLEDLKKARWYLNDLIEYLEREYDEKKQAMGI